METKGLKRERDELGTNDDYDYSMDSSSSSNRNLSLDLAILAAWLWSSKATEKEEQTVSHTLHSGGFRKTRQQRGGVRGGRKLRDKIRCYYDVK